MLNQWLVSVYTLLCSGRDSIQPKLKSLGDLDHNWLGDRYKEGREREGMGGGGGQSNQIGRAKQGPQGIGHRELMGYQV